MEKQWKLLNKKTSRKERHTMRQVTLKIKNCDESCQFYKESRIIWDDNLDSNTHDFYCRLKKKTGQYPMELQFTGEQRKFPKWCPAKEIR